ncbi:hypothetical protein BC643_4531 [Mangrovibacterium diazotrophicum]|uniref:Uncharacterized protein n=1 Tax=Mangrovibacterium diazotrophicum TaxID=1261403 RepID=A0A419VU72_9BACT|nr:hypothetical protein BC643_4531 [Mangrovibacterium diazotrophicum]
MLEIAARQTKRKCMNEISTWNFYLTGELCFVSAFFITIRNEKLNWKQDNFPADIIISLISKFKFSYCRILPKGSDGVESLFTQLVRASFAKKFNVNYLDSTHLRDCRNLLDGEEDKSLKILD